MTTHIITIGGGLPVAIGLWVTTSPKVVVNERIVGTGKFPNMGTMALNNIQSFLGARKTSIQIIALFASVKAGINATRRQGDT